LSGRLMVIQYACPRFSKDYAAVVGHCPARSFGLFSQEICLGFADPCKNDFGPNPYCLYLECSNVAGDIQMSPAA
jgi:hypothetical protein